MAQPSHSLRVGEKRAAGLAAARAPVVRRARSAMGNMMMPATRLRAAAMRSGGMVSTPTRMAR